MRRRTIRQRRAKQNHNNNKTNKENDDEYYINRANKIGGRNDFDFVDSETTFRLYSWITTTPILSVPTTTTPTGTTVPSLKKLCIDHLSTNTEYLTYELIESTPWSIWKPVWSKILQHGQDSPEVYSQFARKFSQMSDFKAHKPSRDPRNQVIGLYQVSRLHRFETVFKNIDFSDLIPSHLRVLQPLVFLDLSHVRNLPRNEYFHVFNIPTLVGLDLSYHDNIDDTFPASLRSCIKSGKLTKLIMVKVNGTKISSVGMNDLFELCRLPCRLSCIESDVRMSESGNWVRLTENKPKSLPLSLKVNALIRLGKIVVDGIDLIRENVFDVMVVDEVVNDERISQWKINDAWEIRRRVSNRLQSGETYVLNRTKHFHEEPKQEHKRNPRKLQKRIKLNANSFFRT
ncbi:hypothetical protein SBY92_002045 [Candida maltosa Xu316]